MELVVLTDLKSVAVRRVGSTPTTRTILRGSVGIGSLDRFRFCYPKGCGGSTPPFRTKLTFDHQFIIHYTVQNSNEG